MPFDLDITESLIFKMGEAHGETRALTLLLEHRFGPVPKEIRQRIATASTEQMDQWLDREPSAQSLNEFFADQPE